MLPEPIRARYAELVVGSCLAIRDGDLLAIHGEPAHRDLAEALAAAAYARGARYVDTVFVDPRLRRARILGSAEEWLPYQPGWAEKRMRDLVAARGASISINGPSEPGLLNDADPRRAAMERSSRIPGLPVYSRAVVANRLRFCVIADPLPGWAGVAYPDLAPDAAARRVGADLARFCRIGPDDGDGTAAFDRHIATLARRGDQLTALALDSVELRGDGTRLTVGLEPGGLFVAADEETVFGDRFRANLPTEEVFTSPDPRRTEGTFRCTRPLTLDGRRIDGIHGRFVGGRLVEVGAGSDADTAYLTAYFARDRDAGRLGELALVDTASRIGQSGRTYGITLLDENAVSHIALGSGYGSTRAPGARRVNASAIHVDVMIGAPELEVTGIGSRGRRIPLIRDGVWQGELA